MKRLGIFLCLLFIIFPLQARAILCTNDKKVKYQALASNITTSYTYQEVNGTITFQITLSNINSELIIKDVKNDKVYPYQGKELIIPNLKEGTSYRFDVYVEDMDCDDKIMYSHYVNTPSYNPYYQDEICRGMENYSICQKWSKVTVSYEEFKRKVEELKKEPTKPIIKEEEEEFKTIGDYLLEFYLSYYYIVLPIFIVGGIVIIIRYNKKNDLF